MSFHNCNDDVIEQFTHDMDYCSTGLKEVSDVGRIYSWKPDVHKGHS